MNDTTSILIEIVWLPGDWEQPPLPGGESAFALANRSSDESVLRCSVAASTAEPVQDFLNRVLSEAALEQIARGDRGVSVFGRRVRAGQRLYYGDRIELLGRISADPKSDRHKRVKAQRGQSDRSMWNRQR